MKLNLKHIVLGALGAAVLVPAAASAQPYGYTAQPYGYGRPGAYDSDRDFRSDRLAERTERLREWMRRGSEEGWLRGRPAQRAWSELRAIQELGDRGYGRREAWQRLDRLTDFVRDARGRGY